jgi:hypothetical protein
MLRPTMALLRLRVLSKGKVAYDENFHYGLNIIRGDNGGGKSTIADLIFFALGGSSTRFKPEALECDTIYAELEFNQKPLVIRRTIGSTGRNGMMFFWGKIDEALQAGPENWQLYSSVRSENQESYSELLFRELGIPEVKAQTGANLTFYQILRLLYVDQLSSLQSLLRDDDNFDTAPMRSAIYDTLVGIYDDQMYSDIYSLRDAERKQLEAKNQSIGIQRFLEQSKIIADSDELGKVQKRLNASLATIEEHIEKASTNSSKAPKAGASTLNADAIRNRLKEQKALHDHNLEAQNLADLELNDSRLFVAELKKRLQEIDEAIAVNTIFGELPLSHCPCCLSVLKPVAEKDSCPLCREPLSASARHSHIMRMKHDLAQQLRESSALLDEKEVYLQERHAAAVQSASQLATRQQELNSFLKEARSDRESLIDNLFTEKGRLLSELEHVSRQAQIITTLEQLRGRLNELTELVKLLETRIERAKRSQTEKKTLAATVIQEMAIKLLSSDQVREPAFGRAEKIEIDPAKNAFALDGRNNFSASSIVYLKNCIHYAIFFASLRLDFFRYPRFILCDNMEDKGMQLERSRNLQRKVAELSDESDVLHQIIFTTSMIDPSLDNLKYCVGDFYTPGHWSLKVNTVAAPHITPADPGLSE